MSRYKPEVIEALSESPMRTARVGPTLPSCPPHCGDRIGLVLNPCDGWVPPDFDDNTGLSRTHVEMRCPECYLYTIWRKRP